MEKIYSLKELTHFTQNEKHFVANAGLLDSISKPKVKAQTIDFVLNYSKVLSVRKLSGNRQVELILN